MPLLPHAPGGRAPDVDQPLLDRGTLGTPWRPTLSASTPSTPSPSVAAFATADAPQVSGYDMAADDLWISERCSSKDYGWDEEAKFWRCGRCGSNLFSPQPMTTGLNSSSFYVPSFPLSSEPNYLFAPGITSATSWNIPRATMPQPGRAPLGPCRVLHDPVSGLPHLPHGLNPFLFMDGSDGILPKPKHNLFMHITMTLMGTGKAP